METTANSVMSNTQQEMLKFILQHTPASETRARLGQLTVRGRTPIQTPHYIVPTSRGAIPHVSPDNVQKHTQISAVYFGLEDFIEKSPSRIPIYDTPVQDDESILRRFIGLPDRCLSVLGPRRIPSVHTPAHNTNSSLAICTSVGFRFLEVAKYNEAVQRLKPDISTSMADVVTGDKASAKRIAKCADRTHAWLRDSTDAGVATSSSPLFAGIPPLELQQLSSYLSDLQDEFTSYISGLCAYSPATVAGLPQPLQKRPIVCLSDPPTPHALLASIHAGIDMQTVPFVTEASEHGIALAFSFPGSVDGTNRPLGFDMWSTTHATDLSNLSPDCECYSCRRHHRAYVHHLLQANEMVAWTLLQIHNFSIMDAFFISVRESIRNGTFEKDVATFGRAYDSELPRQTGKGPRVRGYQTKSIGGGEPKKNLKAYGKLDDQMQRLAEAESGVTTPDGDAMDIEEHGLAQRLE